MTDESNEAEGWRPPAPPPSALRRLLIGELRAERIALIASVVFVLLSGAAIVAGPTLIQHAIDDGVRPGDLSTIRGNAVAYVVVLTAGAIAGGLRALLMTAAGERMLHRLRVRAVDGLLRLDMGVFERSRRGDVTARVTADVEVLTAASRWLVPELVRVVVTLVAAFVAIVVLSPVIALASLLVVPPVAFAAVRFQKEVDVLYPAYRRKVGAMAGHVVETLEATATVQAYRIEDRQLAVLREVNDEVVDLLIEGSRSRNRLATTLTIARAAVTATVIVMASFLVLDGNLSVGTAAAGIFAVSALYEPVEALLEMLNYLMTAKAALSRVASLALLADDDDDGDTLPTRGKLELRNVSFSYTPSRLVLDDVSLTVAPGERVALVGHTGAGKSTIARLAVGLSHPDSGVVRVGGVDLERAAAASKRRALVLIPQEPYLIAGTIADNARLADPAIDAVTILEAAQRLGIHEWIATLPDGIDTEVGVAGRRFSAGQQQLISLLRAVLADPAVLVLDEATSVLDTATEELVAQSLHRAARDRAVIVIAHRMSTAVRCDRVVVVEAGRVVEDGAPRTLLDHDGPFAAMQSDRSDR